MLKCNQWISELHILLSASSDEKSLLLKNYRPKRTKKKLKDLKKLLLIQQIRNPQKLKFFQKNV